MLTTKPQPGDRVTRLYGGQPSRGIVIEPGEHDRFFLSIATGRERVAVAWCARPSAEWGPNWAPASVGHPEWETLSEDTDP